MVEATLRKQLADLQLDYLDMYLVHSPVPVKQDPANPTNIFPVKADGTMEFEYHSHIDTWRVQLLSFDLVKQELLGPGIVREEGADKAHWGEQLELEADPASP